VNVRFSPAKKKKKHKEKERKAILWVFATLHKHVSIAVVHQDKHTAAHCNTLQHTATHCNTLQHTATHCSTLQHTATYCNTLQHTATHCSTLQHTATHCNTLQHTAAHCNTLQHTADKHMSICGHTSKKNCQLHSFRRASCGAKARRAEPRNMPREEPLNKSALQKFKLPNSFQLASQCVAVCCSVLQCAAVCCSVMQCVAV